MTFLIKNIRGLVQAENHPVKRVPAKEMAALNVIDNSFLLIEDDKIADFGDMSAIDRALSSVSGKDHTEIDASGRFVFPSFCDSHTHLVYAGSREKEFVDRIRGITYENNASGGGGILSSVEKLRRTGEDELFMQAYERILEIIRMGTGAVEIKSGYGLTLKDELKILRVIKRLRDNSPLTIKSTFLGAHAVPEEYINNKEAYIDYLINDMIPAIVEEDLAEFIDVFCDRGYFSVEDTERILIAGSKYGLVPKIHANELDFSGGVQVGVRQNALSVDHLERSGIEEINVLRGSETMPTLLPGAAFFLGLPDPPARMIIDEGIPVALASDFNPGSSPSGNMKLVMSLACIRLKMLPAEAINAATINSAYAMGLSASHGSVARGKKANLFITKNMPSYEYFIYAYGSDLIDTVILKGRIIDRGVPA